MVATLHLSETWAQSLFRRMGIVKRKATTKRRKLTPQEFQEHRSQFLSQVSGMIKAHNIPSEMVLNWDQTGIHLVPAPDWTMDSRGVQRVEIAHMGDQRQVTAAFAVSLSGTFLPMQILYGGKTERCHPHYTTLMCGILPTTGTVQFILFQFPISTRSESALIKLHLFFLRTFE